jgi:riboflavin synthase
MFTGIVEEVGELRSVRSGGMVVGSTVAIDGIRLGDSMSVNGVCLTVTEFGADWFAVDTVPETLRRSNLGSLAVGDPVNLERPLSAAGRLGGHFVQGHVEATASVDSVVPDGEAVLVRFIAPADVMRYIVAKGFVTIDGVSLTIVSRDSGSFVVTLIPFTREHTNLGTRGPGDMVNIETDILAKYVENLLTPTT